MKGIVFEIERWSLSDGPGTRTVVFLKGCPLTCLWCSNPESQSARPQIGIFTSKCIECGKCRDACFQGAALEATQGGFARERICSTCGDCVDACPSRARRWMGQEMETEDVLAVIRKDMVFYRRSMGGVTFSGGEPLRQSEFLKELVKGCRKTGIHTAVETCGAFDWETAKETVSLLDFVMFDLKHMDPEIHKTLTGKTNKRILENAQQISKLGIPMLIRIPVIPSLNDSEENITATADFVRDALPSALGIEPLPYHQLGLTKYAALGKAYLLYQVQNPDDALMEQVRNLIVSRGVTCVTTDTDLSALQVPALKLY